MIKGPHVEDLSNSLTIVKAAMAISTAVLAYAFWQSRSSSNVDDDQENHLADDCMTGFIARRHRSKKY